MLQAHPVSPPVSPIASDEAAPPGTKVPGLQSAQEEDEEIVDTHKVAIKDVIDGVEKPQGPLARPMPTPPSMTTAEQPNLTHQPPHRGCPICAANRTPNIFHGPTHEHERTIPLLVGDYCFMRSILDKPLMPVLVMRLYPYRICLACAVPHKGA